MAGVRITDSVHAIEVVVHERPKPLQSPCQRVIGELAALRFSVVGLSAGVAAVRTVTTARHGPAAVRAAGGRVLRRRRHGSVSPRMPVDGTESPAGPSLDHQQRRPLCLGPMPALAEDDELATRRPLGRYRPPQRPRTALIWPPLMTRAVRGRRTRQSPDGPYQHLSAVTAFPNHSNARFSPAAGHSEDRGVCPGASHRLHVGGRGMASPVPGMHCARYRRTVPDFRRGAP